MYHMLSLNHGKRRLDCMLYKQTFSSRLRETSQQVVAVDEACDAVLNCSKLKKVRLMLRHSYNSLSGDDDDDEW